MAILGGTGKLGPGLAAHLAASGRRVIIGSRQRDRAVETATDLNARHGFAQGTLSGDDNASAAQRAAEAIVTVPMEAIDEGLTPLAAALTGKLVVSTVVPLEFTAGSPSLRLPDEGSAAQRIARLLPGSLVSAAFHTVSSAELTRMTPLDADSLICADDEVALEATAALVRCVAGLTPVTVGGLEVAAQLEAVTVLMLLLNRRNRGHHAGIRITGLG